MNKYKTFWRRFGAAFLDIGALAPVYWIDMLVQRNVKTPIVLAVWFLLDASIGWIYSIIMHGSYGQTLGKFACQVRVLDKSEKPLSMKQAFYRDAVPICLWVPLSVPQIVNIMKGDVAHQGLVGLQHVSIFATIGLSWFFLELISMLTNKKRRAIHDYIAGSVVVISQQEENPLDQRLPISRQ